MRNRQTRTHFSESIEEDGTACGLLYWITERTAKITNVLNDVTCVNCRGTVQFKHAILRESAQRHRDRNVEREFVFFFDGVYTVFRGDGTVVSFEGSSVWCGKLGDFTPIK